jgi:hypothetical protein
VILDCICGVEQLSNPMVRFIVLVQFARFSPMILFLMDCYEGKLKLQLITGVGKGYSAGIYDEYGDVIGDLFIGGETSARDAVERLLDTDSALNDTVIRSYINKQLKRVNFLEDFHINLLENIEIKDNEKYLTLYVYYKRANENYINLYYADLYADLYDNDWDYICGGVGGTISLSLNNLLELLPTWSGNLYSKDDINMMENFVNKINDKCIDNIGMCSLFFREKIDKSDDNLMISDDNLTIAATTTSVFTDDILIDMDPI